MTATIEIVEALSPIEEVDLDTLERRIRRGLHTFYEVGDALMEIRDRRLHRVHYGTFEEYCVQQWDMSSSRARQLIGAAQSFEEIKSVTTVTLSERAVRQLAGLEPEQKREAITTATTTAAAEGKTPTANHVKAAVAAMKPKPTTDDKAAAAVAGFMGDSIPKPDQNHTPPDQSTASAELEAELAAHRAAWLREKEEAEAGIATAQEKARLMLVNADAPIDPNARVILPDDSDDDIALLRNQLAVAITQAESLGFQMAVAKERIACLEKELRAATTTAQGLTEAFADPALILISADASLLLTAMAHRKGRAGGLVTRPEYVNDMIEQRAEQAGLAIEDGAVVQR